MLRDERTACAERSPRHPHLAIHRRRARVRPSVLGALLLLVLGATTARPSLAAVTAAAASRAAEATTVASSADRNPAPAAPTPRAPVLAFSFDELPALPDGEGVAGAIAGRSGPFVVVAGGANFPTEARWESPKRWHDAVLVLDLRAPADGWRTLAEPLPFAVGYGATVTDPARGIVTVGGDDGTRFHTRAAILATDGSTLATTPLPDLPTPLAYASAALSGSTLAVFGGQTAPDGPASDAVWLLDLAAAEPAWRAGAPIPTGGRILSVAAAWRGAFHLFSGAALEPDGDDGFRRRQPYLAEAWRYEPAADRWTRLADLPRPAVAAPSPAIALGWDMLAIPGGDTGELASEVARLKDDHPGFARDTLVYHPITDRWSSRDEHPVDRDARIGPAVTACAIPVAATATPFDGRTIVASGELRPRTRTPRLAVLEPLVPAKALAALDWIVIALYLGAMLAMGAWFARRKTDTNEFFLAGRRIPWWAAGVSIFATSLSAITFMAIPAKTWDTDWTYFLQNLGILVVAPVAAWLLVPAFRRLEVTTAYEYLEHRFHWSLRLAASALYMLFQVGRVSVVTLLPALALSAVTGFDTTTCILLMGAVTIVYTSLGGIEAVIWSDVAQAVVLFGGALWALVVMMGGVDGGVGAFLADASDAGKLRLADWSLDLTRASVVVIVLGAIFSNLIPYASDQSIVQRYLSVRDEREAKKAVLGGALLALPASLLFFALGTAMWGFYRANPAELEPTRQLDQVLPGFIVNELPAGISGLVLAGLFAAAMSSLDSAMNSVSTAFTNDWYARFRPGRSEVVRLRVARLATVAIGVVGTGAAILMARLNAPSLLDLWFQVIGLFGSGVAGVFLLGALTRRTGAAAGWAGLVAGAGSVWAVGAYSSLSGLAYSAVGVLACLAVGVAVGAVSPRAQAR